MFNNINDNNEFLYNSQFDKQSNIVNIAALRANVNKTIKTAYSNPYVDKTEISANAMEMFQRDCDINKFTKIAMEQRDDVADTLRVKELFTQGVKDLLDDNVLSNLVTNSKLWDDLEF